MPEVAGTYLSMALRNFNRSGRKKKLKSFPRMRAPVGIEREYLRWLVEYVTVMGEIADRRIISQIPRFMGQLDVKRPEQVRQDTVGDDVSSAIRDAKLEMSQDYTLDEITNIARQKGVEVSTYNRRVLREGIKRVVGIDVFTGDQFLQDQLAMFTSQNVNLITSIPEQSFQRIESITFEGLKAGRRVEEIQKELVAYIDPSVGNVRARAELIARDQIGKLNGNLTQLRQSELGINRYRWRTSGDERVRESHLKKEGRIYSWDKPPADTGHPGDDYQCRCQAEPVLEDLVPGLTLED